jgi:hypothetical protein
LVAAMMMAYGSSEEGWRLTHEAMINHALFSVKRQVKITSTPVTHKLVGRKNSGPPVGKAARAFREALSPLTPGAGGQAPGPKNCRPESPDAQPAGLCLGRPRRLLKGSGLLGVSR